MGRPVKSSKLAQFAITTTAGPEEILEQTGTRKYRTASTGTGAVFLADALVVTEPGTAALLCQPFGGGAAELVSKVSQHRCVTFAGNSYDWVPKGTVTIAGQAELNPDIVLPFSVTTSDIPDPENKGGSGYDKPSGEDDSGKCEGTDSSPIKDGWYSEDKIEKTTAEKAAQTPKRKAKAKAKEQSKPIEDLLAGLDNDSIEV